MIILKIDPVRNQRFLNGVGQKNLKEIIEIATEAIKQGKVIICPTDTVYGLLADATNKKSVEKIFKIKKRPRSKPLPIFVRDVKMAKELALIDKRQEKFLNKVWPGKLTVVLKRTRLRAVFISASARQARLRAVFISASARQRKTIALRIPKYKLVIEIIKKLNRPLAQTSVNISNQPPITKIEEIISHFQNKKLKPELILDAGNLPKSKPSTVIDLTGKKPKILRH